MTDKKQWLKVTRASRLLAVYYSVIELLEYLSGDLEIPPQDFEVDERLLDLGWVEERIMEGSMDVRVRPPHGEVFNEREESVEIDDKVLSIRVVLDREVWGVKLGSLYEFVPGLVLRLDSSLFKGLAFETSQTGIEYMGIYLANGVIAFFEGERYRVSLPFVRSAASVHTHPEGSCALSLKDIESGLDLLVEGGLFEAAATTSCAFVMYRYGLVTEDDFFRVKEALLRGSRGVNKPLRLDSIRFYSVAY